LLLGVVGKKLATTTPSIDSAMSMASFIKPYNSLAVVINKELGTTISTIYISSSNLTKVVDPASLLCAISSKIIN